MNEENGIVYNEEIEEYFHHLVNCPAAWDENDNCECGLGKIIEQLKLDIIEANQLIETKIDEINFVELQKRIEELESDKYALEQKLDEQKLDEQERDDDKEYFELILRIYELYPFGTVDAINELERLKLLQRDGGFGSGYRDYGYDETHKMD